MGREARVITVLASSFKGVFICLNLSNLIMAPIRESIMFPIPATAPSPLSLGLGVAVAPQCYHSLFAFFSTFIFIDSCFIKLFNVLFEHGIYFIPGI